MIFFSSNIGTAGLGRWITDEMQGRKRKLFENGWKGDPRKNMMCEKVILVIQK